MTKVLLLQNRLLRRRLAALAGPETHQRGGKRRKDYRRASFVTHVGPTGANTQILISCASLVKNPSLLPSPGPMKSVKERRYQDHHPSGQR